MEPAVTRPRVVGEREREILDATIKVLTDVGYDKLTFDVVASQARASKATLYRKWSSKADLVVAAVSDSTVCHMTQVPVPDTGSLVGDLEEFSHLKHVRQSNMPDLMSAVAPALHRDDALRERFVEAFTGPRIDLIRTLLERARERGEIRPGADLDLLAATLPAYATHHSLMHGSMPPSDYMSAVIEQVLLPAAGVTP